MTTKKAAPKKRAPAKKAVRKRQPPKPHNRSQTPRLAKRLGVLAQCLEAGYNPVEGLIKARKRTEEVISDLGRFLDIGGPVPWFLGRNNVEAKEAAIGMLQKLHEYAAELDDRIMPYCHPKLRSTEETITGPDGGPLMVHDITSDMTPEEAARRYQEFISAGRKK